MATTTAPAYTHRVKTRLPDYARNEDSSEPLATFLGLFSVGLGLAEVLAPGRVGEMTGVRHKSLVRAYGARELLAGVGILMNHRPAGWLWARVAGDVLDLATLAAAYAAGDSDERRKALIAAGAVAGVTVLDVICAERHSNVQ